MRHGGDGAHHRQLAHVAGAEIALQAPDRDDQLLRHAELLLDAAEDASVAPQRVAAALDAGRADSRRDVFLEGLAEGAALAAVEGEHVRVDVSPAKAFCATSGRTPGLRVAHHLGEEAVEVAAALGGEDEGRRRAREEEPRRRGDHMPVPCSPRRIICGVVARLCLSRHRQRRAVARSPEGCPARQNACNAATHPSITALARAAATNANPLKNGDRISYPRTTAACGSATGASACAAPWPRLADALARHRELLADLFERVVGVHADAEAHAQHALFSWRQGRQDARGRLAQVTLDRSVDRQDRVLVLDEIAEVRVFLITNGEFRGRAAPWRS